MNSERYSKCKNYALFFFNSNLKIVNYKKSATSRWAFWKNAKRDFFGSFIIDHFYIAFNLFFFLLFLIFKEYLIFQKVSCFVVNWLVGLILDLPFNNFSLNKYFTTFFRISFKKKMLKAQLFLSLLFWKTYKFLYNMWCVMQDVWCSRLDFFFKILTLWLKGRPKIPPSG